MSKREKETWEVLNDGERKTWWECLTFFIIGGVIFIFGYSWLEISPPELKWFISLLALLCAIGFLMAIYALISYAHIFMDRISKAHFYQKKEWEKKE